MNAGVIVSCVLGFLVALGGWERWQRDRAQRQVRIRVHVNGTRGKSTVTRLIAAALRESGLRTVAKTTGTAARLILPDGTERPIARRAPASIREQLWVLREARRSGADALVVECMAIDPALQRVSERDMVNATIGVITNVRPDHGDVMGHDLADVAAALAQTVPARGVLVLGRTEFAGPFEREALRVGARMVAAPMSDPALEDCGWADWQRENAAVALAVTRELGIPDAKAIRGMLSAAEDPGGLTVRTRMLAGRALSIVDASAANDPESLALLLAGTPADGGRLFVFNHRADRPIRLRQFAEAPVWKQPAATVLLTGDTPDCGTRKAVGLALDAARLSFAPAPLLARVLRNRLVREREISTVVFCGNTKQLDVDGLLAAWEGA